MTARKGEIRLTSTSYVVLGMLDWLGPSTPYRLKRVLAESVQDFFPVPHTSFYAEPARLAAAGRAGDGHRAAPLVGDALARARRLVASRMRRACEPA